MTVQKVVARTYDVVGSENNLVLNLRNLNQMLAIWNLDDAGITIYPMPIIANSIVFSSQKLELSWLMIYFINVIINCFKESPPGI
jgi:hypothetical protein